MYVQICKEYICIYSCFCASLLVFMYEYTYTQVKTLTRQLAEVDRQYEVRLQVLFALRESEGDRHTDRKTDRQIDTETQTQIQTQTE